MDLRRDTAHMPCMCDVNPRGPRYACQAPPRRSSAPAEPYTLRARWRSLERASEVAMRKGFNEHVQTVGNFGQVELC